MYEATLCACIFLVSTESVHDQDISRRSANKRFTLASERFFTAVTTTVNHFLVLKTDNKNQ